MWCCSSTAQNNEEISGRNLVDVVPVCQIKRSSSTKAPETLSEFVVDSESGLWRSHLDMKHTTEHRNNSDASTESESERLSEDSNPEDQHLKIKTCSSLSSRKISAQSFRSYRSTGGSKHYPFPQRKSLRKSETARRLGLYASL